MNKYYYNFLKISKFFEKNVEYLFRMLVEDIITKSTINMMVKHSILKIKCLRIDCQGKQGEY